jgi:TolB-like protein
MTKLYILLIGVFMSANLLGQTKSAATNSKDIVYKTNGEQMTGKVTKVTDNDISFVYTGETAEYVIKKSDVEKIVHSSGRVETFDEQPSSTETRKADVVSMTASPTDHHNKIAVLPFTFLIDRQPGAPEMGYKAQDDTYDFLVKHSAGYTILDTRTTNALLIKAGVTKDKMMGFTMKEICDILGVEYVVDGTITQTKGYQTSSTSDNINTTVKRNGPPTEVTKTGIKSSANSYSNAVQRYDVAVGLNIFMDNNASIYNQNHKAIISSTDGAYDSPLEYLLKRCPLYRK